MFYWFVLALLATWRVTHLLARERGPGNAFGRLRLRLRQGVLGGVLACFSCLSVWVAAPFAFVVTRSAGSWVVTWLALSGGAVLLDRLTRDPLQVVSEEDAEP